MIIGTTCMGGNEKNLEPLFNMLMKRGHSLIIVSDGPLATHKWTPETWKQDLALADVIICVQRADNAQPYKSSNRVTQAQSMGKPVIASPLPSYIKVIEHGSTGFIAHTLEDWERYLTMLEDPELRTKIGEQAKQAATKYSVEKIAHAWNLNLTARTDKNKPICDIIVPTWDNQDYLKTTIESIRKNTDWPHTITVVNSGTQSTQWLTTECPDVKLIQHHERLHFSEAVNKGIKQTTSPYVAILNDDLIVAEHWLTNLMFEAQKPDIAGANPWSNCDLSWRHQEKINVSGINLVPSMKLEQVQNIIPQLYKLSHKKEVKDVEWLPFFCTVLKRSVIDEVGPLDERFKSGSEDVDMSRRIVQAGHKLVLTFDSVVFHFGGISRARSEKLNPEQHRKEDIQNNKLMNQPQDFQRLEISKSPLQTLVNPCPLQIGGGRKLNIAFYTGPAWETWDLDTPNRTGIGGSETVVGNLAREFVKLGHKVQLYGQHAICTQHCVNLSPYEHFKPETEYDLLIVSRNLDIINNQIKAKKIYAVAHDIWFQSNIKSDPKMSPAQLRKIDKYIALSPWHRQFLLNHHQNIPEEKLEIIPNYFDVSRYQIGTNPIEKVPGRLIYASSLDRGLLILLHCYKWVKEQIPELSLRILYGVEGWEKALKVRGTEQDKNHFERVMKLIEELKPHGVEYVGKVNQLQLADEFKAASCWAYPTFFCETFCLTALEAFTSKTPVITTNLAALNSTVGDGGILLSGDPTSTEYCQKFVNHITQILQNKDLSNSLAEKGLQQLKKFNNADIINKWLKIE